MSEQRASASGRTTASARVYARERVGARVAALAAGSLIVATFSAGGASAQDVGLPLGTVPDAVVLEDLDGEPVDLADHIGQGPVLLEFWATWCPLCEALEPRMEAAYERYGDEVEFLVVAVGVNQSPRRIRRHLEDAPIPGRVLWDGRGRASRAFQAPTTSYIVVLDADGRVTYTGTGEDQDIVAAVEAVVGSE